MRFNEICLVPLLATISPVLALRPTLDVLRTDRRGPRNLTIPLIRGQGGRVKMVEQTGTDHSVGGTRVGVIVCDHGSRRETANNMLFEVVERYRSFSKYEVIEPAHMELAEPTIEQAFDRCVEAGAEAVVCHPFFLSPGRHVTSDIPALMETASQKHPGVSWVVSNPLGLQELMPQVMHATVLESLSSGQWRSGNIGNVEMG
ncbi:unnamed protein product [Choristocarpus tenellus]